MFSSIESEIMFFDLTFFANARNYHGLQPKSAEIYFDELLDLKAMGRAKMDINKKMVEVFLADIKILREEKLAILLINRTSLLEPDIVLRNIKSSQRRVAKKDDDEGNDFSSHIIICLEEIQDKPNTYLMLMEKVPGITISVVNNFLNKMLRASSKEFKEDYLINDPGGVCLKNGSPKKIKSWGRAAMVGHLSDDVAKEIDEGELLGIELVSGKQEIYWDDNRNYKIQGRTLKISAFGPVRQILKEVLPRGQKENWERARVRFRTSNKKNESFTLPIYANDVMEAKYVRKEIIDNFSEKRPTSFEEINDEIVRKMLDLR